MTTRTVLHLTRSGWGGGQERFVQQLSDEAIERGWRCVVAYYDREPPPRRKAEYVAILRGGAVRRWPFAFRRLLQYVRPDVLHVHGAMPGSLGAAVARTTGRHRVVFTDHAVHRQLPARDRLLRTMAARIPHASISVCRAGLASLIEDARVRPERAHLVPYGTPEVPMARPPSDGEKRLLYVANFWPYKGQALLVRALSRLDTDVRLDLVGEGVERPMVERLVTTLGLSDRVRFLGYRDDAWEPAAGAWAYVHPSTRDATPLAVIEALMRGLPVVASPIGGIGELVQDERSGLLVPTADEAALAAALGRILADRGLRDRLADGARRFAISNLSLAHSLARNFEIYDRLLATGR